MVECKPKPGNWEGMNKLLREKKVWEIFLSPKKEESKRKPRDAHLILFGIRSSREKFSQAF